MNKKSFSPQFYLQRMSEIYISFDYHAQDVNSDQTPLVAASLMNHPFTTSTSTRNTTNCSSTTTTSTTTHSITNNYNNVSVDYNNRNSETTAYKRSLINPALVKRKLYSKVSSVLGTILYCSHLLCVFSFNPLI